MGFGKFFFGIQAALFVKSIIATPETDIRDVCIIGGGSAGTYAAIQLQRHGMSVALVEKESRLGGNVDTYKDPSTGQTFDNGVIVFDNIPVVTDYFNYLDIPLAPLSYGKESVSLFANFETGKLIPAGNINIDNTNAASEAYLEQLAKYPYLINGFNLPDPVPRDFLLSWGEYIKKYKLGGFAYDVSTLNQGIGNILDQPALYMLKYLNDGEVHNIITGDSLTTKHNNNQKLYDKALTKLGSSAFVSSEVTSVMRSQGRVEVSIDTPNGSKLISARHLVIAIRPTLAALEPWLDLRSTERELFAQFNNCYYWCGLVEHSGIPANTSLLNANLNNPYGIPGSPGLYSVGATGLSQDVHSVYYSSPHRLSDETVKSTILKTLATLREGFGIRNTEGEAEGGTFQRSRALLFDSAYSSYQGWILWQTGGIAGKGRNVLDWSRVAVGRFQCNLEFHERKDSPELVS